LKLALGTVQFGVPYGIANQSGQVSREEAKAILALARSAGIDTLDTAIAYGESEACLGAVGTAGFKVVTKLPAIPDSVDDVSRWVEEQMQASLQRLGIPIVHGLLLHRSQQLTGVAGKPVVRALEQLKAEGIVHEIGVSIYSPTELEAVTQSCAVDLVQAPLNLIDRRLRTSGWLQRLHDAGVDIHARSAFLQGLLLMPRSAIPAKFAPWRQLWDAWHDWLAARRNISAAQVCIGFVQSFPEVNKVVVGVESAAQLEQLIVAANAQPITDWPAIETDDEMLINPSNWYSFGT
jgi:hypothetical protein